MKRVTLGALLFLLAGAAVAQGIPKGIKGAESDSGERETSTALTVENHKIYFGADYTMAKLSVSNPATADNFPVGDYDVNFVDIRAGYRILKAVGVEAHYGVKAGDESDDGGRLGLDHYYGIFVVPTATVFNTFELAVPLGYSRTSVTRRANGVDQTGDFNSASFGVNIEIPIRTFWSALPDIRLTGGGTVYDQKTDARLYGYHFGARFDFGL